MCALSGPIHLDLVVFVLLIALFSVYSFVDHFLSFFVWPMCCLSFYLQILITQVSTLLDLSCFTERVTVNNVTNINYTSTNLSPENNELRKRPRPMAMEMQVMAWDRQENRFKGPPLENWISNDNKDTNSMS